MHKLLFIMHKFGTLLDILKCSGLLAQLVEQQTLNLQVQGSSPWRPTMLRSARFALVAFPLRPTWLWRTERMVGHPGTLQGLLKFHARVAKLVDALALGASPRKRIGVRVPSLAPSYALFWPCGQGVSSDKYLQKY